MTSNAFVNVSVSNHYKEPSRASEVTTQGLLGEQVEILENHPIFIRIRQAGGYESWIPADQIVQGEAPQGEDLMVRSHFMRIHVQPSVLSEGVKDAVIGCSLKAVDQEGDWYRIALPDGASGWAEKRHFGTFPGYSPENIITLAREFLGYQYAWGGRSPKGFDCSGFVQTVFRLHGVALPRDSWQQQQHNLVSTDPLEARPGDLLFFGKSPDEIDHVAISIGDERFIHASGWVRYNSFRKTDADFSRQRLDSFVSVNRYTT